MLFLMLHMKGALVRYYLQMASFYRLNLQTNIFQCMLPNSMSCSVLIKIKRAASPLSHVY